MGAWDNAKPIPIPQKPLFRVRDLFDVFLVGRSHVEEMRRSEDTGNVYMRIRDAKGRERYVLLEENLFG